MRLTECDYLPVLVCLLCLCSVCSFMQYKQCDLVVNGAHIQQVMVNKLTFWEIHLFLFLPWAS